MYALPANPAENVNVTLFISVYVYSPITTVSAVSITVIEGNFPKLCCITHVVEGVP